MAANEYASLVDDYVNEAGVDQNESTGGGGDFALPEEGLGYARVVEYIELGAHFATYQGKPKPKPEHRVRITFELISKKWPAIEGENGTYHHRISVRLNLSTNERARFFKLFRAMNDCYGNKYKHMAQMVADNAAFKVKVVHSSSGEGDKKRTYANLDNENGWLIYPATRTNEEDEEIPVNVPDANIPTRIFLFNKPRAEDWAKLHVEGTREDGSSRNWLQETILSAVNFPGSPLDAMLADLDTPEPAEAPKGAGKSTKTAKTNAKEDDLGDFDDDIPF